MFLYLKFDNGFQLQDKKNRWPNELEILELEKRHDKGKDIFGFAFRSH